MQLAVFGDIMLDAYIHGSIERISPEAPVPVFRKTTTDYQLGGAANVARNAARIVELVEQVTLFGVVGEDEEAETIGYLLDQAKIERQIISVPCYDRPTTVKSRVIAKNQQIMRLDQEGTTPIPTHTRTELISRLYDWLEKPGKKALILSDYDKGVVNHSTAPLVIEACNAHQVPVYVDPKKTDFSIFKGARFIKPNLAEATAAWRIKNEKTPQPHDLLSFLSEIATPILTCGEEGVWWLNEKGTHVHDSSLVPKNEVVDVCGAGDSFLAAFVVANETFVFSREAAIRFGSAAAAVTCKTPTVYAPSYEEILLSL